MTLDPEFKRQTEKLIQDTLELYKNSGASTRIGQVWDCKNIGDFLCGFFVGETDDRITLARDKIETDYRGIISIPKENVLSHLQEEIIKKKE